MINDDYRVTNIAGYLHEMRNLKTANKNIKRNYKKRGLSLQQTKKIIKEHNKEIKKYKDLMNKWIDEFINGD